MSNHLAVVLAQGRELSSGQVKLQKQLAEQLGTLPGIELSVITHLYDLPPEGHTVGRLRAVEGDLVVLSWLYPRAAFWVLDANGVTGRLRRSSFLAEEESDDGPPRGKKRPAARSIWCVDLRVADEPNPFLREVRRILVQTGRAEAVEPDAAGAQVIEEQAAARWYPVVDYDRCNGCLECLNFCLFGVFDVDEQQSLRVEQADACRPGCPACARICPSGAIMFPAHQDPRIAGGTNGHGPGLKLDLSQLFRGAEGTELAAAERARALAEQDRARHDASPPVRAKDDLDRLVDGLDELP